MDEGNLKKILTKLGVKSFARQGKWLQFSCPLAPWTHRKRTDNNPSCGAHINEQGVSAYKCFSCKKHGLISSLVRSLEHYRDKDYGDLAFQADMMDAKYSFGDFERPEEEPDELQPPLNEAAFGNLYEPAWGIPEARAYLKGRGIGKQTAEYMQLGYDPDDFRIVFPVRGADNLLYGFSGRSILKEEEYPYKRYPKVRDYHGLPKRHLLLGAELVDDKRPLFVHEGLFGQAHLIEIGADDFVNPLAMMGSEMTDSKAQLVRGFNRVTILMPDNDEAGDACLYGAWDEKIEKFSGGGAVDRLQNHVPLCIPQWPEDAEDIDQLTREEIREIARETPLRVKPKKKAERK